MHYCVANDTVCSPNCHAGRAGIHWPQTASGWCHLCIHMVFSIMLQTNCSCDAGAQTVKGKRSVQLNNKSAVTPVVPSYVSKELFYH